MPTNAPLPDHLARLGESLDRAVRADLAAHPLPRRRLRRPRRVATLALVAVALPAVAYAADQLITPSQVAASLPQGTKALIGTSPTCTIVKADVEYHCVLANAPTSGSPRRPESGSEAWRKMSDGDVWVRMPNGRAALVKANSEPALKHKILTLKKRYSVGSYDRPKDVADGNSTATTDWTGADEPTVDATAHVNGGCRAENAAGTAWECYIGEAAVDQNILSQGFLGQYAPSAGVG